MEYGNLTVINDDIVNWSKNYDGERFHALITDSPYEYGFLDKKWDSTGVGTDESTWVQLGELLYPGAFGLTYGGSRTWHKLATALENAGFIIHPTIFCWTYATGLHKAKHIDTIIDKEAGVYEQREIIEKSRATYGYQKSGERWTKDHFVTRPVTDEAIDWWEYRYGLQSLRPAVEPIILFQKPYKGKWTDSIREYGAGAFHIEATKYDGGKWPTNFIVVHHPLCTNDECYQTCNVASLPPGKNQFLTMFDDSDTMIASQVFYHKKSLGLERSIGIDKSVKHPTIKPISVNAWLAKLLLPPEKYSPRRLLVPFAGVMSEAIGGIFAGWEDVVGIEINSEYAVSGANRADWWINAAKKYGPDVDKIISATKEERKNNSSQLKLEI